MAGWVHRRRDHGGLIFIDLRDRTGLLQLVFRPEEAPEAHAAAGRLRGEDVITVSGELVRRDESAVNPDLPTGEVELVAAELEQLADSETPPFQIDEDDPVGEELRLRYRYLDLRKERMRDNMILRHRVVKEIRDFLADEGYLEIETPIMTRSTPEGARDFLVPSRLMQGSWYALPQSPQLFKQLLMIGGYERYFQIARCFRDEDFRADRQPEFTQLDMELAFVEEEDVHEVDGPPAPARAGARRNRGLAPARAHHIRRVDAPVRLGPPRPAAGRGDRGRDGDLPVLRVQGLQRRARHPCHEGDGRISEEPFRCPHREGPVARREGARLGGGRRGRRLALADRQVPIRGRDRAGERRAGGEGGGRHPDRRRHARGRRARPRRPPAGGWAGSPRATTSSGSSTSRRSSGTRTERRWDAVHHPFTSPAGDLDADPGTWRAAPTTWSSTAGSSAAARSVTATPRSSRRCST